MNSINDSTNRYAMFGKLATEAGHRPGSGEWWTALRTFRDASHNAATQPETERISFAVGDVVEAVYHALERDGDGDIINPQSGEKYDPDLDLWTPEQYEEKQKARAGIQHIIREAQFSDGRVTYATDRSAWHEFDDFKLIRAADAESFAQLAADEENEEDGEDDE